MARLGYGDQKQELRSKFSKDILRVLTLLRLVLMAIFLLVVVAIAQLDYGIRELVRR